MPILQKGLRIVVSPFVFMLDEAIDINLSNAQLWLFFLSWLLCVIHFVFSDYVSLISLVDPLLFLLNLLPIVKTFDFNLLCSIRQFYFVTKTTCKLLYERKLFPIKLVTNYILHL